MFVTVIFFLNVTTSASEKAFQDQICFVELTWCTGWFMVVINVIIIRHAEDWLNDQYILHLENLCQDWLLSSSSSSSWRYMRERDRVQWMGEDRLKKSWQKTEDPRKQIEGKKWDQTPKKKTSWKLQLWCVSWYSSADLQISAMWGCFDYNSHHKHTHTYMM